ncbi:hypothetical protein [Ferrovibrio xuzhouensis]|uniref:Uncharacterized protein n=1 Tax=Ferrovibrio xuzhouensis TaxID=1576914 RepID=A0ABV7VCX2_9PROT
MTMMLFDLRILAQALWCLGFILLGAVTFRLRGSGLWDAVTGTGTTGGRLQYATLLGLAGMAYGADWRLLALVPALFLGCLPPWFDDGLVPAGVERAIANAVRGLLWLYPSACVFALTGYDCGRFVGLAGLASAPLYMAAWALPMRPVVWRGEVVIGRGTELAELLFGGWIGLCIWWAVTAGVSA